MKYTRKTQMAYFEAQDLPTFAFKFNDTMDWLAAKGYKHQEPVIKLDLLQGYVIYESVEKTPEGLRDLLFLQGKTICCNQCVQYNHGDCPFCRGKLRDTDEVCDKFYRFWEKGECWLRNGGEEYEEAVKASRQTA